MVMSAYMMVGVCRERPVGDRDCVLHRGDNEAVVHGVRHCLGSPVVGSHAPNGSDKAGGWLAF